MPAPRSLADALRQRDDASLAALLIRRPDLVHPAPSDFTALASRSTTGPSIARCLDSLDALTLHVLATASRMTSAEGRAFDAIVDEAVSSLDPSAHTACVDALRDLIDVALIWGDDASLKTVHSVADLVRDFAAPNWPAPELVAGPDAPQDVDAQAALHARGLIEMVRDLLDDWSNEPPTILRSGGLSLRDFAAARVRLHSDWRITALVIELAYAARLFADDGEADSHWVPTDRFDIWLAKDTSEQWLDLTQAWLTMPRLASLADQRTQLLTAERDRGAIPVIRRDSLTLLAEATPGKSWDQDSLLTTLDYRQPRRAGELRQLTVDATLFEANALGLTAAGAMSTAGRAACDWRAPSDQRDKQALRAMHGSMPAEIDHILIQADLTAVAPGPVDAHVARTLRLLADIESRGHATVYRFSDASIGRAVDAGWDAASIRSALSGISRTSLPQPLEYAIDDIARRHGTVRVGAALGYLRCDDTQTLTAILSDKRLAGLGLSRIADTVIVSQVPPAQLIREVRACGYSPAAETPEGSIVIRRPADRRIATPKGAAVRIRKDDSLAAAAVRALRATGPARSAVDGEVPALRTDAISTTVRTAVTEARPIWIGYADTDGTVLHQIVDPIRVQTGILTAFDHRTEQVRTFAVSRITGVAEVEH